MNWKNNFPLFIKRRPFVRFMVVVLIVVAFSRLFLLALWFFHSSANLPRVQITAQSHDSAVEGIGLNLKHIPSRNLIQNPSFEDSSIDKVFSVEGYDDGSIYVLPEETKAFYEKDDFFKNGKLRVMAFDDNGFTQHIQSTISEYKINQLGLWNRYELPRTKVQDFSVSAIATLSSIMVAVGNNGTIIADPLSTSSQVIDLDTNADFVACVTSAERFWALAGNGDVYTSQDGRKWNAVTGAADTASIFYDIALIGSTGISVGSGGTMIQYYNGKAIRFSTNTNENLYTVSGDGNKVLAAGANNTLLTSSNGNICRLLTEKELPEVPADTNWISSDYNNGMYLLGSENGFAAIGLMIDGSYSFTRELVLDEQGNPVTIQRIKILNSGSFLIQSDTGDLYFSEDKGKSWISLDTNTNERMGLSGVLYISPEDLLYFVKERMCYQSRLYTRISFEKTEENDLEINRGNMLFLNTLTHTEGLNAISSGVWEAADENSKIEVAADSPADGGNSSLRLSGAGNSEDHHAVIQKISGDAKDTLEAGKFYRIDIWLKQKNIENDEVMLWFTGGFDTIGKRFINVGESWRQYSFIFSIPRDARVNSEHGQKLYIGFQGAGELYIDQISLTQNAENGELFNKDFIRKIKTASPQYVRLENLNLGVQNTLVDTWHMPVGNEGLLMKKDKIESAGITDLSSSLQLVNELGAIPWFVIDSNMTSSDIEAILAYMCGPFSDPYGKMRIAAGKAVTWEREFDRFVFEITDSNQIFDTDMQRGAFVRYIQSVFPQSKYFLDIKDRLFFLDGMNYESGKMDSLADSHTSSLRLDQFTGGMEKLSSSDTMHAIDQSYLSYFDGIPRIVSGVTGKENNSELSADEWIRSASFLITDENENKERVRQKIDAAQYVYFFTHNLGLNTSAVLSDIYLSSERREIIDDTFFSDGDFSDSISVSNGETIINVVGFLNAAVKGQRLEVQYSEAKVTETDENNESASVESGLQKLEGIQAFAFQDGDSLHIILLNLSNQTKMFRLDSDLSIRGSTMKRYSENGSFMEETRITDESWQISLTPGQVAVVSK